MVLPPDGRRQQDVLGGDRRAPRHVVLADVQPLRVLVEHRVDDVRERFVGVEEAVAAGEQVAFEPPEQRVLRQHLHDPAVGRQLAAVGVLRKHVGHPRLLASPGRCACSRLEAVSSGPKTRKLVMFCFMTSRRNSPSGLVFSYCTAPWAGTSTAYLRKSGSFRSLRSRPPLACGLALMRRAPRGASAFSSGTSRPFCVEQLLGPVAAHPALEQLRGWPGCRARPRTAPGARATTASTLWPLISFGPVHPLGERSTIIGQRGRTGVVRLARGRLNRANLADGLFQRRRHLLRASSRDRCPRRSTACSRSRRRAIRAPRG